MDRVGADHRPGHFWVGRLLVRPAGRTRGNPSAGRGGAPSPRWSPCTAAARASSPERRVELSSSPRDQRLGEPVRMMDEVEGERPFTHRLPSLETYDGSEVTLTIRFVSDRRSGRSGSRRAERAGASWVFRRRASWPAGAPSRTSGGSAPVGISPRGSRRRARTRCRASRLRRSGRSRLTAPAFEARAPSTASPPGCSGHSARRGCRRRCSTPSAGPGHRRARAWRPEGQSAPSTPRSSASWAISSAGRPGSVQMLADG